MKPTLTLVLFLIMTNGMAAQSILEKPVTLSIKNKALVEIFEQISTQTAAKFTYDKNRIPTAKEFNLEVFNSPLKQVLEKLFQDTNIEFKTNNNFLIIYRPTIPYHSISGFIQDAKSKEALIEANVFETSYYRGCSSNQYGFYSLSLPEGIYLLKSRYIGYEERTDTIALYKDIEKDILMTEGSDLAEVIVIDNIYGDKETTSILGTMPANGEKIDVEKAKGLPTLLGEKDVFKYLQLLPGVVAGGLAGNNLYIRGGALDQNLIMLDDIPLYNVNHLWGFISIFDGEIVQSAKTYVAGFPARYGGRLSSIIDIRTKDGNKEKIHGGLSMGLYTFTTHLEGPIKKDKSSFILSARRTWLDIPLKALNADPNANIYDLTAKANFKLSEKDRFYFSFYTGKDYFEEKADNDSLKLIFKEESQLSWGNTAFSLRWNRTLGKKVFVNTTLFHSVFNFDAHYVIAFDNDQQDETELSYQSFIKETGLKTDFSFSNARHHLRWGSGLFYTQNNSGEIDGNRIIQGQSNPYKILSEGVNAQKWMIYAEDKFQITPNFSIYPGLRLAMYKVQNKTRWYPQPRLELIYSTTKNSNLSFSYSEMMQSTHLLDNTSLESNNIRWVIATKDGRPSTSKQAAISFQSLFHPKWSLKFSAYYKTMNHLRRLKVGEDILSSLKKWEKSTLSGKGRGYGLELLLAKVSGTTQGWASYTYSKSERKFDGLANNTFFPYQYDRRHSINFTMTHSFKLKKQKKRQLSLVWIYATGHWYTLPSVVFPSIEGIPLPANTGINNFRLEPIHRLDLAYLRTKITAKGYHHTWNIGVYNVYGKANPFSAELQFFQPQNTFKLVSNNLGLDPIPYVSYSFKF